MMFQSLAKHQIIVDRNLIINILLNSKFKEMRLAIRFVFIVGLFSIYNANAQQQNDQTLITLGSEKIPAGEFARVYLKNATEGQTIDSKSVEEYLNLFINFRLKVADAKGEKLDTSSAFKNELAGYRQQLARPYMVDKETEQDLIKEAYERMKYDVNASHILVAVSEAATPADTLKLYEKAIAIRNRIISGEPFDVVARATSDDPSVTSNNGVLGYFSAFQMVYPFESGVYKLKIGELSMPIRTRFGYHIIKLNDKRQAKGQVKVAHIMIASPKDASAEQQAQAKSKIQDIYKQVLNNEDFSKLASQFSQDPGSAKNGGELPWLGTGNIVPEFEQVAFSLNSDGQVSDPFQTPYGWHIVKRLGRKTIGSFEDMLPEIKKRLSSDMRSAISFEKMIVKIKKENNYKEDTLALRQFASQVDSSIFKGIWTAKNLRENKVLFNLANQKYDDQMFGKFLEQYQRKGVVGNIYSIVKKAYNEWVNSSAFTFQESILEQQYPEFKYLMQEYHDGILLFNISDLKVWSKASNDSIGLQKFYYENKENYRWGERVHYLVFSCSDQKQLGQASKMLISGKAKSVKPDDIITKLNKGKQPKITLSRYTVNIDDKEVEGYKSWANGISGIASSDNSYTFKAIDNITTNDIKEFSDCKGQAISDFQQTLEEEWIKSLRNKYPVVVDKEVLNQLINTIIKK